MIRASYVDLIASSYAEVARICACRALRVLWALIYLAALKTHITLVPATNARLERLLIRIWLGRATYARLERTVMVHGSQ